MSQNVGQKVSQNKELFALVAQQLSQQGWRYGLYLAVIGLFALVTVLPPRFYAFYVEHVSDLEKMTDLSAQAFIKQLMVFGLVIAVVMFVGNLVRILCEEWVCLRIEGSLRYRFMDHSQRLPFEKLDGAQRGEWLTRMSRDIRVVEQFMTTTLPQQLQDFVIVLAIAGMFVYQNGVLAVILLLSSAAIAAFNFMVQRRLNPLIDQLREMHGQVFQTMLENFEGMRTIRSFRIEGYVLRKFDERVGLIIGKGLRAVRWVSLMVGSNAFAVNLLTAGILSLVGWMLRGDKLTVSDVFSYPFYIGMFYSSLFALVRSIHDWNDFMVHGKRLMELNALVAPAGPSEAAAIVRDEPASAAEAALQAALSSGSDAVLALQIKQMSIGYAGSPSLTRPFDFELRRGEIVVVKGSSGCGKSTLLEALAGLRQFNAKEVRLYGAFHKLLAACRPRAGLRLPISLATLVEQRPFLFSGSLRDNIELGRVEGNDAALWQALTGAHIAPLASGPEGLDFAIYDDGGNLSEGQKHRLSLARALFHKRGFVLLDEPFAALDEDSIATIVASLNGLRSKHAVLIVSHFIPRGLEVDRVVNFDDFTHPYQSVADVELGDCFPVVKSQVMVLS